jgi:hypothetical protein
MVRKADCARYGVHSKFAGCLNVFQQETQQYGVLSYSWIVEV